MHMAVWNALASDAPELPLAPLVLMLYSLFALLALGDRSHTLRT